MTILPIIGFHAHNIPQTRPSLISIYLQYCLESVYPYPPPISYPNNLLDHQHCSKLSSVEQFLNSSAFGHFLFTSLAYLYPIYEIEHFVSLFLKVTLLSMMPFSYIHVAATYMNLSFLTFLVGWSYLTTQTSGSLLGGTTWGAKN